MSSLIRLRLLPRARCFFDEPVQVKVAGLRSRQAVTMRARSTDERGVVFSSSATYRADDGGEVDLNRHPSLGGSYVGVEPMGLLWSLRAEALHQYFEKGNALEPHVVTISVHEEEGRVLAEAANERVLLGDGVTRLPVNEGNINGVLFTPPGPGPFPAVLDLNTITSEKRAALLANKGFVVLALGIFNVKATKKVTEIHLDHFRDGIDFLQRQPKVGSKGVGVISRSKSAEIALSLSVFVPDVKACVWINGYSANSFFPLYYKNKQILSSLMFDHSKVIHTESGGSILKYAFTNPRAEENKGSLIPVEQAKTQFLFVASEDDLCWDSKTSMDEMIERLKRQGKDNFESVYYPGAGHILEPPYGPFCMSSPHLAFTYRALWGGEPRAHAAAEVHLWKKTQEFFRAHLSCEDPDGIQIG
ncbi:acyl-coenzyme A thioesterase 1-like [Brachionichthys hirsutus]|uniref:acyl-coenzyme A thioesterase 1-like n=1 Tax=Brachionichthys hirsutus TaxID=412623 RepID=UPI0036044169